MHIMLRKKCATAGKINIDSKYSLYYVPRSKLMKNFLYKS